MKYWIYKNTHKGVFVKVKGEKMIAEVIIGISHESLDKIFHYIIPETMENEIEIGIRVLVPFGKGNKKVEGFVIGLCNTTSIDSNKLKEIYSIVDQVPFFDEHLLELAKWMKEYYGCRMIDCLRTIMPSSMKIKSEYFIRIAPQLRETALLDFKRRSKEETEILSFLMSRQKYILLEDVYDIFGKESSKYIKKLSKEGIIEIQEEDKIKELSYTIKYISINKDLDLEELEDIVELYQSKKNYHAQARILSMLMINDWIPVNELKKALQVSNSSILSLANKNIVQIEEVEIHKDPYSHMDFKSAKPLLPTQEQKNVIQYIISKLDHSKGDSILIHGITVSGKTEIYLQLIEEVIKRGGQSIVLVPEISLTPQTVERFKGRFGDQVAVTHSKLSLRERYDQWKKAKEGKVSVMIGPRSAVFTPFTSLKLIILDEEHENTYKSEISPKFHARDVARKRCEMVGGVCVVASATPSLESYFECEQGKMELLTLSHRANESKLPSVEIIDMRKELELGNRSIFSVALKEEIEKNLKNKEQTILFLNRRGFSNFVSCRKCGYVLKCKNCSISYTYHAYNRSIQCHYCGDKLKVPSICPQCGSSHIRYFGVGTERVESEVKKHFPDARVLRMDLDTAKGKYGYEKILDQFKSHKADILIGTQMIAKGHDFPNVTLVGILAADLTLHLQDFRSAERTFQLITQVSGRAGRGELPGRVLVQTYDPSHYSIETAKDHDYMSFYQKEIELRKQLNYPPFTHIFLILITGTNEKLVISSAYKLMEIMKYLNKKDKFELFGPVPAILSKIKNKYRWRIIVKCDDRDLLMKYSFYCISKFRSILNTQEIQIQSDIDPLMMY